MSMAVKGQVAKENFVQKVIELFKDNYVGCVDKKWYFWEEENGERVQVAISLTCPKTPVSVSNYTPTFGNGIDFEAPTNIVEENSSNLKVEISEEERQNILELMSILNL